MNRPWGIVQLVESEHYKTRIPEEYIFVIETDHMMMKAHPNDATPERPVGFGFYYMLGTDPKLKPVVEQFLDPSISAETVDAVGPSPILIHKPLLAKVARPWWDMSQRMQKNGDAQRIFGWVLEMWGYNIAARNMGIRHTVSKDIQVEPQGEGTDDMDTKYIYHYTFGLTPKATFKGAPPWRLDKRQYYGGYPSDHLDMPPACTAKSGFIIASMWNEAAQNITNWPNRRPARAVPDSVDDLRTRLLGSTTVEAPSGLAERLRGTGPWRWGRFERLFFYSRGIVYLSSGAPSTVGSGGRWSVTSEREVTVHLCRHEYTLTFTEPTASEPWSFTDSQGGQGTLSDRRQQNAPMLPSVPPERTRPTASEATQLVGGSAQAPLLGDVAGTGPWFWAGSGPLSFMRNGVLITPWGEGKWGVERPDGEKAPDDSVFADFAGSQHKVRMHNPSCLRMRSERKADGDVVGVDYVGYQLDATVGNCQP